MDKYQAQSLFKRSRHNNRSTSIISQDCYELSKKTLGAE